MRPLGVPAFNDKLLQEVVRMILEAIYERQFEKTSHGFRPLRSCHTALSDIQKTFSGVKWFVEGDIKGFFDNINHEILKIGDERLKNAGYHPYVLTCDAEYLPFPDGYFDVLIVSFGLRNMTHKDRALKEMQRVLKPGGRLMVLEFSKPNALMRPFYDFYSFKVMPFLSAKIAGHSENYRYLAESIRMHPDQKTLAKIMREAGFDKVEWKNLTFGITALHIGYKN